ncbi:MAG TPA: hypothetical protein VGD89_13750 [Flavipsychrobacter sp.]
MTREKALEAIKDMPADFELDQLIEKLIVVEKLEAAIKQVNEGDVIYHSDVKKKIDEWKKG